MQWRRGEKSERARRARDSRLSHRGLISLPPTHADLAVARACAGNATAALTRTLRVVTWLADEKILLGGAVLFWLYARSGRRRAPLARHADRLLCSVALAGALPHLFKRLVNRKRPDRVVIHGGRHGIPRFGNAWDSFPSGHAVHVGAVAASVGRIAPYRLRPLVWPAATALAATRIVLLAHYFTDVAAGLALGALLDRTVGAALPRMRGLGIGEPTASAALDDFLWRRSWPVERSLGLVPGGRRNSRAAARKAAA
jgi:membrane-associated phospholipid phosphatase